MPPSVTRARKLLMIGTGESNIGLESEREVYHGCQGSLGPDGT